MPRANAWVTAVALTALCAGCASLAAQRARTRHLDAEMKALRYPQPVEQVWGELSALLKERGFPLADARSGEGLGILKSLFSPARGTAVTSKGVWMLDTGWAQDATRVHAEATPGEGGTQVVLTRIVRDRIDYGKGEPHRDLDLELELARRLAPDQAARIEGGLPK